MFIMDNSDEQSSQNNISSVACGFFLSITRRVCFINIFPTAYIFYV